MEESEQNFRTADIWRRPQTEELVDVHVYLVPSEEWIEKRKLANRDIIDHAVSSGFVRVIPSTTLFELRNDINEQLGSENVPETYVFLRSVGRNFTQVKPKQELDLKVKSFIPPCAEEPEVYVKEGSYTLLRSSSLGPSVALSRESSSRVQNSTYSVESTADFPTSSESARPSLTESNLTDTQAEEEEIKRTQSLDRRGLGSPAMASRRAPILHQRQQQIAPQRRSYASRNKRPATPRVKEMPLKDLPHSRSKSIASVKTEEVIRESPTEQLEENETPSQNLVVDDDEKIIINSPPPRPSTASNAEKEVRIPVPTPTPTPVNTGKEESEISNTPLENQMVTEAKQSHSDLNVNVATEVSGFLNGEEQGEENNDLTVNSASDESENRTEDQTIDYEHPIESSEVIPQEMALEQSQLSFDNINSKMGDEDVIVDPIKLLEGEGESLKNAEENGRDHYDEGFHSGELVNSEEDSNSIETLGSSEAKDEDLIKPTTRAATPMPRSNSFYKPGKLDPEIRSLQSIYEDTKADRRLKELKRDALLHKVRDLQRRKASSKDQAREEWRKRYQEVKKSTPRLEDHCSKLRQELEKLVKDMLVSVKTDPDSKPHKPSKKTSYKIMIMRLLQEVEDLRRRLQSVTVKLNAETKLRAQAEFEVKKLRQDLLHKKTQVTLTRKQASFPPTTELFFISAV